MNRVLAVVVAYGYPGELSNCVDSLNAQTYPAFDYVVWDNGGCESLSGITSIDYVQDDQIEYRRKRSYHKSDHNMYWTPALNAAIEQYKNDDTKYILTLNHDVILPPHCVSNLVRAFNELGPFAGAVGPTGHGMGGLQGVSVPKVSQRERVNYLIGACTMYRMEAYEKVGPFDENMPLSGDDFDYAMRLREAGYSMWVDDTDPITHVSHITRHSPEWNSIGAKSWDAFNKKYANYFKDETEARKCLWEEARYDPAYDIGTGISDEEKIRRGIKRA